MRINKLKSVFSMTVLPTVLAVCCCSHREVIEPVQKNTSPTTQSYTDRQEEKKETPEKDEEHEALILAQLRQVSSDDSGTSDAVRSEHLPITYPDAGEGQKSGNTQRTEFNQHLSNDPSGSVYEMDRRVGFRKDNMFAPQEEHHAVHYPSEQEEFDPNLRFYTAFILYHNQFLKDLVGQQGGQWLRELAEEVNHAKRWSLVTRKSFQTDAEDLVNEDEVILDMPSERTGAKIPGIHSVTLLNMFDHVDLSPDISLDTGDRKIEYGLDLKLKFLPGDAGIYWNGPENEFQFSMGLRF